MAHELKTPLAIARGEIELALSENRSSQDYKKALEESLKEIDRLIRIIKDMLLLAKLDYRPEIFKFDKLDLDEFMKEIYEQAKVLASEKNIELTYETVKLPLNLKAD